MVITLNELVGMGANGSQPVDVIGLIGGKNTTSDLLWLAGRKLPKEKIVRFACDCALLNIEKIKPYTDKYDQIVAFLRRPTAADAAYAAHAAHAAADAAYAAHADAAAHAAAYAAHAHAAAYAAHADAHAAYAARADAHAVNDLLRGLFS